MRTLLVALFLVLALAPGARAYMMDSGEAYTPLEKCTIRLAAAEAKLEAARQNTPDSEFVTRQQMDKAVVTATVRTTLGMMGAAATGMISSSTGFCFTCPSGETRWMVETNEENQRDRVTARGGASSVPSVLFLMTRIALITIEDYTDRESLKEEWNKNRPKSRDGFILSA